MMTWSSLFSNLSVVLYQLEDKLQTPSPSTYKALYGQDLIWFPRLITFHFSRSHLHSTYTHMAVVPHPLSHFWASVLLFSQPGISSLNCSHGGQGSLLLGSLLPLCYWEAFFDTQGRPLSLYFHNTDVSMIIFMPFYNDYF